MLNSLFNLRLKPKSLVKANLIHFTNDIFKVYRHCGNIMKIVGDENTARVMFRLGIIDGYQDIPYVKRLLGKYNFVRLTIAMNMIHEMIGKNMLDFNDILVSLRN